MKGLLGNLVSSAQHRLSCKLPIRAQYRIRWIMEKKMETTISGLGFRDSSPKNGESNRKEHGK